MMSPCNPKNLRPDAKSIFTSGIRRVQVSPSQDIIKQAAWVPSVSVSRVNDPPSSPYDPCPRITAAVSRALCPDMMH
jgi:hypothetical protein